MEAERMTDEKLAEIRRGVEGAQEEMRAYSPLAVHKAAHFNAVSAFDRICADMYVFQVVPALLDEVERQAERIAALEAIAQELVAGVYYIERGWAMCAFPGCEEAAELAPDIQHVPNCPTTKARALLPTPPEA